MQAQLSSNWTTACDCIINHNEKHTHIYSHYQVRFFIQTWNSFCTLVICQLTNHTEHTSHQSKIKTESLYPTTTEETSDCENDHINSFCSFFWPVKLLVWIRKLSTIDIVIGVQSQDQQTKSLQCWIQLPLTSWLLLWEGHSQNGTDGRDKAEYHDGHGDIVACLVLHPSLLPYQQPIVQLQQNTLVSCLPANISPLQSVLWCKG